MRPGKIMGASCAPTCRYSCAEKINDEKRKEIFDKFWSLNAAEKHFFIATHVKIGEVKRRSVKKQKENDFKKINSFKYYLKPEDSFIRVCKTLFLNTLAISNTKVAYFFEKHHKKHNNASVAKPANSGRKGTTDEQIDDVVSHIESFPAIESHYCRSSTTRKYLDESLNVTKMYNLYKVEG